MPGAKALIAALAKSELIEVRRVELVARDFAAHVEAIERAPSVRELERWLEAHPQITELSASDDALEALLAEHLAPPKPPPATVRNPELEREIYQSAHPERAIAVYADWLQERNDPFGEQLAIGLAEPERFDRYLRDNIERILGEHHREYRYIRFVWRHGLIDKLGDNRRHNGYDNPYRPLDPALWAALLQTRSCEMIRELTLSEHYSDTLDATLAQYAPPGLMSVIIEKVGFEMPRLARRPFFKLYLAGGTVEVDSDSFHPKLEELSLAVHDLEFRAPPTWNIRTLHVHATPQLVGALRKIELPRLERLTASGDQSLVASFPKFVAQ